MIMKTSEQIKGCVTFAETCKNSDIDSQNHKWKYNKEEGEESMQVRTQGCV